MELGQINLRIAEAVGWFYENIDIYHKLALAHSNNPPKAIEYHDIALNLAKNV